MNRLWTFGDSAVERNIRLRPDMPQHETWTEILAKKLNFKLSDHSWGASSLDFTYYHYRQQLDNFKEGDIVIIGLTDLIRGWFIEKTPNMSTAHRVRSASFIPDSYKDFVDTYFDEYFREDVELNILHNFLDMLVYHQESKGIKVVAFSTEKYTYDRVKIPKQLNGAIGVLWQDASMGEVIEGEDEFGKVFYNIQYGNRTDTRLNHVSEPNHSIWAEKMFDSIHTGQPMDFTTGFLKNIMSINELIQ